MKMRYFSLLLVLVLFPAAVNLCAANKPHADRALEAQRTWTNEDLERLSRIAGSISIVGQIAEEATQAASAPAPHASAKDPEWFAEQAASLRARLESTQGELRRYTQAIEDARDLKTMTGGVNIDQGHTGITLEAGIQILNVACSGQKASLMRSKTSHGAKASRQARCAAIDRIR